MDSFVDEFPALEPPPGIIPNFTNPPTMAGSLAAALAIMMFVATLLFLARMYTKVFVMKQFQIEDYSLILGWIFFIAFLGVSLVEFPFSVGRHQWDVSLAQMESFLQLVNYSEALYGFCMLFTKLAIILQIKRIFQGTTKDSVYWLSLILMVLDTLLYVAACIVEIAECVPREKIWNPFVSGVCINNNVNLLATGGFNLGLDILIFALPIYAIFRLRIVLKRKLGICTVFATGLLACISSLLRLYYSVVLINTTDVTFNTGNLLWTAGLEGATAILVASFPIMPRLYQFICSKTSTSSTSQLLSLTRFSFTSLSRRLLPAIAWSSRKSSTTNNSDEDGKQLGRRWSPLQVPGTGPSKTQIVDLEKGMQNHGPESFTNPGSTDAARVKLLYQPAHRYA